MTIATIFCDGDVGGRWRAMVIASASDDYLHISTRIAITYPMATANATAMVGEDDHQFA